MKSLPERIMEHAFRAPGLAKAKKRLAEITARWHNELPEAMRVLERGFTAATQFYAFPEARPKAAQPTSASWTTPHPKGGAWTNTLGGTAFGGRSLDRGQSMRRRMPPGVFVHLERNGARHEAVLRFHSCGASTRPITMKAVQDHYSG